jgi:hydroxyacylglutathione hydrolase
MSLRIERVPTLSDNYTYVIACEETGEAAIVDAPEAEPVVRRVDALGVRVTKVLSTHHHLDHSAANPELAKRYGVPVFGHASDAGRLPGLTDGLEEGDTLHVGRQTARILHIPAHTRGHIAYVFDASDALFCGDTLFAGGCGRLFEGTPEMMYEALCVKLAALPDPMRVFCGHEYTVANLAFAAHVEPDNAAIREKQKRVQEIRAHAAPDWHDATPEEMTIPSTLADERATNPFLRAADAAELGAAPPAEGRVLSARWAPPHGSRGCSDPR